jgi:mannose/fructose/N-acetylgalactosamine-specific phosphotransferase system component IIC
MLGTALLIGFVVGLIAVEGLSSFQFQLARPLVVGPIIGALLGDVTMGLKIGAELELIWMGIVGIGAAVPPDVVVGTGLATSLAILSNAGTEVALALAVPVAMGAQALDILIRTLNAGLAHRADRLADLGDYKGIERTHLYGMIGFFLRGFVPTFLAISLGAEWVKTLVNSLPEWLTKGFSTAGGMMAALGFAMLINMIGAKKLLPYLFGGFALVVFFKANLIAVAVVGTVLALLHLQFTYRNEEVE